jgi:hypothetical protein
VEGNLFIKSMMKQCGSTHSWPALKYYRDKKTAARPVHFLNKIQTRDIQNMLQEYQPEIISVSTNYV